MFIKMAKNKVKEIKWFFLYLFTKYPSLHLFNQLITHLLI